MPDYCFHCNRPVSPINSLSKFLFRDQRQYVIDKIKAPLMKVLCITADKIPEPTKENATPVLIEMWDKFFEMEDNPTRNPLFRALRKITVSQFEDPYYRDRMKVFAELLVESILEGKWTPRELNNPPSCWKNDYRGAGYEFIKKCYEVKHGK